MSGWRRGRISSVFGVGVLMVFALGQPALASQESEPAETEQTESESPGGAATSGPAGDAVDPRSGGGSGEGSEGTSGASDSVVSDTTASSDTAAPSPTTVPSDTMEPSDVAQPSDTTVPSDTATVSATAAPSDNGAPSETTAPSDGDPVGTTSSSATSPQTQEGSEAVSGAPGSEPADEAADAEAGSEAAAGSDASAAGAAETGGQSTEAAQVAVAEADTGSNTVTAGSTPSSDGDGAARSAASTEVRTGDATATGNTERTTVTQDAVTVLTDQSQADVTQLVLVINLGAALATSGANTATAGADGGPTPSVDSGSARAVGNDAATYLTQAATAEADAGEADSASQQVITLRIGLAVANTGNNAAVIVGDGSQPLIAAAHGDASIRTGSAGATGNQSETEVTQRATAIGSGQARLTIEQQATVVNLGVALANSGANTTDGVLGAFRDLYDQYLARRLVALLIPSMFPSAGGPDATAVGPVEISTGDADAIGNQSVTQIEQHAVTVGSGDGHATVRQEALVANVGVGVANSGTNSVTGAASPVAGHVTTEQTDHAVTGLAGFLTRFLDRLEIWRTAASPSPAEQMADMFSLGDTLLGVEGSFGARSIEVGHHGDPGSTLGPRARIRQIAAVLSIGLAYADTGTNTTSVISAEPDDQLDSPDTTPNDAPTGTNVVRVVIATGDAEASNSGLTVVCQLDDTPDHTCLAPAPPDTGPAPNPGHNGTEQPAPGQGEAAPPSGGTPPPAQPTEPAEVVAAASPQSSPSPRVVDPRPAPIVASNATTGTPLVDSLPVTGSDTRDLALAGLILLVVGNALLAASRTHRRSAT